MEKDNKGFYGITIKFDEQHKRHDGKIVESYLWNRLDATRQAFYIKFDGNHVWSFRDKYYPTHAVFTRDRGRPTLIVADAGQLIDAFMHYLKKDVFNIEQINRELKGHGIVIECVQ